MADSILVDYLFTFSGISPGNCHLKQKKPRLQTLPLSLLFLLSLSSRAGAILHTPFSSCDHTSLQVSCMVLSTQGWWHRSITQKQWQCVLTLDLLSRMASSEIRGSLFLFSSWPRERPAEALAGKLINIPEGHQMLKQSAPPPFYTGQSPLPNFKF